MVKLKDAKCPNCGANIQVNDKLENTICQYCGSQVVIEEAIEKYKLEISGKVEVDGIKGRNSKLEQARKHIKLEEYDVAKNILLSIVAEDSLDTESYIEMLKIEVLKMRNEDFDDRLPVKENLKWQKRLDEIKQYYDRIKKIDEENIADSELAEYKGEIDKYVAYAEKLDEYNTEYNNFNTEAIKQLNEYVNKAKMISPECAEGYQEIMSEIIKVGNCIYTYFKQETGGYTKSADRYRVIRFTKINQDGSLEGDYEKITDNDVFNSPRNSLIIYNTDAPKDLEELKRRVNGLFDVTEEYLNQCATGRNAEIDKNNKKIDRKNMVIEAKNKFAKVLIYVDYAIIAMMVIATISTWIKSGIGAAIAMGIFLDSWIIYILVMKIQDHKSDMEINDIYKKRNDLNRRNHVK